MKYFLKQNLPGIKADTEMFRDYYRAGGSVWYTTNPGSVDERFFLPDSELSDWIEERANGTWKPERGDAYYFPEFNYGKKYNLNTWTDDELDKFRFSCGLVCPTPELAIELADRMIETAKKFWEEKE